MSAGLIVIIVFPALEQNPHYLGSQYQPDANDEPKDAEKAEVGFSDEMGVFVVEGVSNKEYDAEND